MLKMLKLGILGILTYILKNLYVKTFSFLKKCLMLWRKQNSLFKETVISSDPSSKDDNLQRSLETLKPLSDKKYGR